METRTSHLSPPNCIASTHTRDGLLFATFSLTRCFFKTIQLRTHSIYPPYIDQDLQNRCVNLVLDKQHLHRSLTDIKPPNFTDGGISEPIHMWSVHTYLWMCKFHSLLIRVSQNTNKHIRLTRSRPSQMVCLDPSIILLTQAMFLFDVLNRVSGMALVSLPINGN